MLVSSKEPAMRPFVASKLSASLLKSSAFIFLGAGTVALAQAPYSTPDAGQAGCPVGISASLQARGQTMWTIAQEDNRASSTQTYGAGVHVDLRALKPNAIQGVTLSVSYLTFGLHTQLVTQFSAQPGKPVSERSKTFQLVSADPDVPDLSGDLLVGSAATIQRVKLLSVRYADGTEWHSAPARRCSIEPSHILLVSTF
jgi:hypothetical protein